MAETRAAARVIERIITAGAGASPELLATEIVQVLRARGWKPPAAAEQPWRHRRTGVPAPDTFRQARQALESRAS